MSDPRNLPPDELLRRLRALGLGEGFVSFAVRMRVEEVRVRNLATARATLEEGRRLGMNDEELAQVLEGAGYPPEIVDKVLPRSFSTPPTSEPGHIHSSSCRLDPSTGLRVARVGEGRRNS